MEERIRNYFSAAAFPDENPSQPVAWVLQYQNGMIGPLYTMEDHRRKGLGLAVMTSLCQTLFEDSPEVPLYCEAVEGTKVAITTIVESLGFIKSPSLACILNIELTA